MYLIWALWFAGVFISGYKLASGQESDPSIFVFVLVSFLIMSIFLVRRLRRSA